MTRFTIEVHIVELYSEAVPLRGAQSVDRALSLLRHIGHAGQDGIGLSRLAQGAALNKATTRRLLLALIQSGMVEQCPETRSYHLGEEVFLLGQMATTRHSLLGLAMDILSRLAGKTGDAAFLSIRRGGFSVCLHREEGDHPVRTYALMPGHRHPLGVGAGSLAMLAALPDAEAATILRDNRDLLTREYPQIDPGALSNRLNEVRSTRVALNPGMVYAESWGLGVALRWPDGQLAGALSLAAVASRMQHPRRDALSALLLSEADRMERRLARGPADEADHAHPRQTERNAI
ncbi:IclR family transcriptional regulator [Marivita sp. S0852]|uniref:IclR family transcriptional regulator n=1 Tax=Marivita sp. S0852 TaxID=3373893 RepID=UPI00398276D9